MSKLNDFSDFGDNLIKDIFEKLKIISNKLDCENSENLKILNFETILSQLKLIEKKTNQLISAFYLKKFKVKQNEALPLFLLIFMFLFI